MVSPDEVRDHERLRLTVFDADRFSVSEEPFCMRLEKGLTMMIMMQADDPLGKVEVSVDRLIRRSRNEHMTQKSRNLFESRTDDLQPMRRSGKTQGKLKYSVGFFGIARSSVREQPAKRAALLKEAARQDRERLSELNATDHSAHAAGATHSTDFANKETSDRITPDAPDDGVPDLTTPFDRFVRSLGLPLDDEVMNRRKQRDIRVAKLLNMLEGSHNASEEAPNPELPTGLLVFHIHSIENLEVQNTQKSFNNSKRLGTKPRYTQSDDPGIEGTGAGKLPSSYVQVMLNDEAIYRTRTKTLNPRPFINGGSERFVGDWRTARIDFVVRDARMREGDPILGVVSLKVAEVLKKASRSTGWYPLTGGLGYGKIGISLLFKSVELSVPAPLRGWNIGVLEMGSMRALGLPQQYFAKRHCHVFFETVGGSSLTESAEPVDDYESGEGESAKVDYQWNLKDPVRVPVRQRYRECSPLLLSSVQFMLISLQLPGTAAFLYIHLRSESRIPGRHHTHAHGVIPLNRIPDDHETFKRVPIFETSDWHRFEQDMLHQMADDDELASPTSGGEAEDLPILEKLCRQDRLTLSKDVLSDGHIKRIGWLEINLIFHSGIAPEHRSLVAGDHEMRFAFEAYQAMTDAGERPKPKTISTARRRKLSEASHHQRPASIDLQKNRMSAPPQSRKSLQVDTAVGAGTSGDAQPVSPQRRRRTLSAADTPTDRNADGDAEKTPTAADRQGPWSPQSPQSPWRPHTPNMQDGIDLDELYEPSLIDDEDRPDAYGDEYEGEDGEGVEEEDDPDEVTPEGRRARRRSLHRQHRGAAQIKTFRTMEWLKTNASDVSRNEDPSFFHHPNRCEFH